MLQSNHSKRHNDDDDGAQGSTLSSRCHTTHAQHLGDIRLTPPVGLRSRRSIGTVSMAAGCGELVVADRHAMRRDSRRPSNVANVISKSASSSCSKTTVYPCKYDHFTTSVALL